MILVEVIESCSMEEFVTRKGGSTKGLRNLDLKAFDKVFSLQVVFFEILFPGSTTKEGDMQYNLVCSLQKKILSMCLLTDTNKHVATIQ